MFKKSKTIGKTSKVIYLLVNNLVALACSLVVLVLLVVQKTVKPTQIALVQSKTMKNSAENKTQTRKLHILALK